MATEDENIELRSEKVRSIIGQIPPILVRIGIAVIFFTMVVLLVGMHYFKYQYTIKTKAILYRQTKSVLVLIQVPASQKLNVKVGDQAYLCLDKIPGLYGERIPFSIEKKESTIHISETEGYVVVSSVIPDTVKTLAGNRLIFNDRLSVEVEIPTKKVSLLERLLASLYQNIK